MFEAQISYGLLKRGHDYKIVDEGYDWYLVATRGKSVYVPRWVFDDDNS